MSESVAYSGRPSTLMLMRRGTSPIATLSVAAVEVSIAVTECKLAV